MQQRVYATITAGSMTCTSLQTHKLRNRLVGYEVLFVIAALRWVPDPKNKGILLIPFLLL